MHEADSLLLSKKEREELRFSKAAKPYDRQDVVDALDRLREIKPSNEGIAFDIAGIIKWVEYMLSLEEEHGFLPSYDGLWAQIHMYPNRWKQWSSYGSFTEPEFFIVRRAGLVLKEEESLEPAPK